MKAFLAGLALVPLAVIFILSLRPGGLRRQLRAAARRFRLALILGGMYLVSSVAFRLLLPPGVRDWATGGVAVALGLAFLVLAQALEVGPARSR